MKSLRGEFFIGYFSLDILHWIFYIRWVLKVSPFGKVKPFFNTARKPDSVRQLANLSVFVKKKM